MVEIGISKTENIVFNPSVERDPEIIAAMSMAAVKKIGGYYEALYREVHRTEGEVPESVLAFVSGKNGVDFDRSGVIALRPRKEEGSSDSVAVEDPTIVRDGDLYYVFHSAVKPKSADGGVLVATQVVQGSDLRDFSKSERVVILDPLQIGRELGRNVDMVKEPEFFKMADGKWMVFYEFADGRKSRIATARADNLLGPYREHRVLIDTREDSWDCWHTSPGPLLTTSGGDVLMFFNGAGPRSSMDQRNRWAIGSVVIDTKTGGVVAGTRSERPLIVPPEDKEVGPGNQLIVFANSYVGEDNRLICTVADKRMEAVTLAIKNL